jgi:polyisoprenyl-teichoic acid--peptidoglycan teichoic acid transferase
MRNLIIRLLICSLFLTGCSSSLPQRSNSMSAVKTIVFSTINASTSMTPTPFQTSAPSPTPLVMASPTSSAVVRLGLQKPDGQVNILLLGSDYRPKQGYRTDVIMILSLNPNQGTATLTSFPRDLYVNIPGRGMNRINAAQEYGGFELTKATLIENFDVNVNYYIMTNFAGFKAIINTLGGITVHAAFELTDTCDLPQGVNRMCTITVGDNTMNGATALWYVRSRETTNDFDRTRRAQEVITAIFKKAMTLDDINRGPELYDLFMTCVESNLPMDVVLQLLPLSTQLVANPSLVKRYAVGPSNVTNYVVPDSGAMVLIPDPVSISEIIRQAFYQ